MNNIKEELYSNLPSAEEYKGMLEGAFKSFFTQWSEPKYQCSECGGGMCRNEIFVYASFPPKYEYKCNKCGHVEYHHE